VVVGHADRMGEDPHNQALSLQRADVVKAYLGTLSGIEMDRVQASGRGSSEPLTAAGDCGGSLARDALIVCLQRDRRVEVDVTGEP
jgi:OOP family OmpA-OmpF porin